MESKIYEGPLVLETVMRKFKQNYEKKLFKTVKRRFRLDFEQRLLAYYNVNSKIAKYFVPFDVRSLYLENNKNQRPDHLQMILRRQSPVRRKYLN